MAPKEKTLAEKLEEFLADPEIPQEIKALVKARLDPEPDWVPEDEEKEG